MIALFQRESMRHSEQGRTGEQQRRGRRPQLWHPEIPETSTNDTLQDRGLSQGAFSPQHWEHDPERFLSEPRWLSQPRVLVPTSRPATPWGRRPRAEQEASPYKRLAAAPSDECKLKFELVQTDGGEYDSHHACSNMLLNDPCCYSSVKKDRVNIIARIKDAPHFTMTDVEAVAPAEGFTSPLGQGIIFVSWDLPDPAMLIEFDLVENEQEFLALQKRKARVLGETRPVCFFDLERGSYASRHLDVPRSGRYVLIKLLRAQNSAAENIDVQYIGFRGMRSPHSFEQGCII